MKTSDLIDQLARDLAPTRRQLAPMPLSLGLGVSLLVLGVLVVVGMRLANATSAQPLEQPLFVLGEFCAFVSFFLLLYSAILYSIPARRPPPGAVLGGMVLSAVTLLIQLFIVVFNIATHQATWDASTGNSVCMRADVAALALPLCALFILLKRRAPTRGWWCGLLAGVAAADLGGFVLPWLCPDTRPLHIAVWHWIVPIAVLGGAGMAAGWKLLRW